MNGCWPCVNSHSAQCYATSIASLVHSTTSATTQDVSSFLPPANIQEEKTFQAEIGPKGLDFFHLSTYYRSWRDKQRQHVEESPSDMGKKPSLKKTNNSNTKTMDLDCLMCNSCTCGHSWKVSRSSSNGRIWQESIWHGTGLGVTKLDDSSVRLDFLEMTTTKDWHTQKS